MANNDIRKEQINNIVNNMNLIRLAKECLGIIESSTMKDKEISMLIESATIDLERVDIDVKNNINDSLIKNTIMMYVKGHFGDTEINKKREYIKRYKDNMRALKESEEYRKKEVESNV